MSEYTSINEQQDWTRAEVIAAGIDIGAVSSKAVILLDGKPYTSSQVITRTPKESAFSAINEALANTRLKLENIHYLVATGLGRMQVPFARQTISEIACGAAGGEVPVTDSRGLTIMRTAKTVSAKTARTHASLGKRMFSFPNPSATLLINVKHARDVGPLRRLASGMQSCRRR